MEISKIDLKILIKEFLTASNRVLRAGFEKYPEELQKYTYFLETHPLIWNYIVSCGEPEFDVAKETEEINSSYGRLIYDLGSTDEKEVANIYAVIKHLADINYNGRGYVFYGYSSSKQYQEKVNAFGNDYIRIMITHIESYLTTLGIRMGVDSKMTINLEIKDSNLSNTQVNLANEGASIVSTQSIEDFSKLDDLVKTVLSMAEMLGKDEKETVTECVETLETIKDKKPKKSIIKMALTTLQGVAGTTEFLASVSALAQFFQGMM